MDFLQALTGVLLVLCALGAAVFYLKTRGWAQIGARTRCPRQMTLIERLPLTSQHALHLVRVGGRVLLVASAPGSCQIRGISEAAIREMEPQKR